MDYFDESGQLYEFSVLSLAQSDGYAVECFDMSSDGRGLVGILRVASSGEGDLSLRQDAAVRVLRRWFEVAETEAGLKRNAMLKRWWRRSNRTCPWLPGHPVRELRPG